MKIEAAPVRKTVYPVKDGKTVEAMDINFNVFLEEESSNHITVCIGVDTEGNVVNFPVVERLNSKDLNLHMKLGKAIQRILCLEGNQMKQYCDKLFKQDKNSSLNNKRCVINV